MNNVKEQVCNQVWDDVSRQNSSQEHDEYDIRYGVSEEVYWIVQRGVLEQLNKLG